MKDFSTIKRGDIVRNIGSGESYVVDANYGDFCIAMRSVHMSNPSEWCAPLKEVEQRADNIAMPKCASCKWTFCVIKRAGVMAIECPSYVDTST